MVDRLIIGGDHAGFDLKAKIIESLNNIEITDAGPYNNESCDYPDFAHKVADAVDSGKSAKGILVCGSGNGVAIVANKYSGVRAGLCWSVEIARLARMHNDINVLCLPARFLKDSDALAIVEAFLQTPFEGGRHSARVNKIPKPV